MRSVFISSTSGSSIIVRSKDLSNYRQLLAAQFPRFDGQDSAPFGAITSSSDHDYMMDYPVCRKLLRDYSAPQYRELNIADLEIENGDELQVIHQSFREILIEIVKDPWGSIHFTEV